ncbi:cytochrome P450 [Streptomyces sp. Ac-502]|uniref:cytochrome P450 n=1 Tax=Streptomyces sp. Ac-502 TaxID=3342801 RepID=UPI003862933E
MAREAVADLAGRDNADHLLGMAAAVMHELAAPEVDMVRIDLALEAVDGLRDWLAGEIHRPSSRFLAGLADVWSDEHLGPDYAAALLAQFITGSYEPILTALCVAGELATAPLMAGLPVRSVREEVLRLATPFRFASRYARRPVTVGPHHLGTGDRVTVCLGTANLDPRRYPEPLDVAERREIPRSFSFGFGKHYCPGAPIARTVIDALLKTMLGLGVRFEVEEMQREPELPMLRYRQLKGHLVRHDR